jgi:hypothetical protein
VTWIVSSEKRTVFFPRLATILILPTFRISRVLSLNSAFAESTHPSKVHLRREKGVGNRAWFRVTTYIDACLETMEAAGIAHASQIPQVVFPHDTCVEQGCQWLHYVCTEEALQELVASWHRLTPDVREKIMELALGTR